MRRIPIETYIATNNREASMLFVLDNGFPKPKNWQDLLHKMRYILEHKKEIAFKSLSEIETPYRNLILTYSGSGDSFSSMDGSHENKSGCSGCSSFNGGEKKSNCSGGGSSSANGSGCEGCSIKNAVESEGLSSLKGGRPYRDSGEQLSKMLMFGTMTAVLVAVILKK